MSRPTRIELLEYAAEGLRTLIGVGAGYEHEEVLVEYESHHEWVKGEIERQTKLLKEMP